MILTRLFSITLVTLSLLIGCASQERRDIESILQNGNTKEATRYIQAATNTLSKNANNRAEYYREREIFTVRMIGIGDAARKSGNYDLAESSYRQVLAAAPNNTRAQAGIQATETSRRHSLIIESSENMFKKGDLQAAEKELHSVLKDNPRNRDALALQRKISSKKTKAIINKTLNSNYQKPITLEFIDANIKSIFELISKTSGINFIFDKDVRPDIKATIFVKENSIEDAVKILLITNQLEQRILNDNSILIYPNVPAKTRDYQDLVVKTFYLANADVKQTANMIKTLVQTKNIFIDEKLNMLIVRDTPEAISIAEKLIAAQDLSEPEVMLEMEVLEISTSRLEELGIRYPDKIGFGAIGGAATTDGTTTTSTGGLLTLSQFKDLNSDSIRVSIADPALFLNMNKTDTDSNLLANPRIRVRNREKAKIHIGERVPVITTTSTANVGVSESVNYLDVGLKLDIEPNIYLEDEVAMKVSLEVSTIIDTVTTSSGSKTYRLGSRTADTTLRLKDGETQILAGLIQDFDRKSAQKIPFLGDIPILGRLFSSHGTDKTKTEIVLLITPHIIRNISQPGTDVTEYLSGTEGSIGSSRLSINQSTNPQQTSPSAESTSNTPQTKKQGAKESSEQQETPLIPVPAPQRQSQPEIQLRPMSPGLQP